MQPTEIALIDDHTVLAVTWDNGETSRLDAVTLRQASRAASEIRRQAEGVALTLQPALHMQGAEPIGNYALRLFFSDGHDRGIYPWVYLRELAAQAA